MPVSFLVFTVLVCLLSTTSAIDTLQDANNEATEVHQDTGNFQGVAGRRSPARDCPAGRTWANGRCRPCREGWYCPAKQPETRCGRRLTSKKGAKSISDCVNGAGHYLVQQMRASADESSQRAASPQSAAAAGYDKAEPCPPDTYSYGYDWETACTPCASGLKTDPDLPLGQQTSPAVCLAPPGYFISDGAAVPCDVGTYSDTYSNDTCIPCMIDAGVGITTAGPGATSASACSFLEPGYALAASNGNIILEPLQSGQVFKKAVPCPQGYYCPGGDPAGSGAPQACLQGMWTQVQEYAPQEGEDVEAGAATADQCLTPPGFYLPSDGGDMQECPTGTYKEGWDKATTCTACGEGLWLSDPLHVLLKFDPATRAPREVTVRGTSESCFIQQGMGTSFSSTGGVLRALVCPTGMYGNDVDKRYGLEPAPCHACPAGLVTAGSNFKAASYLNAEGVEQPITATEGGHYSVQACRTRPGWGYYGGSIVGGAAAKQCQAGEWNEGSNLDECKECPTGTTTASVGAVTAASCNRYAAGFGPGPDGATAECPIGTYSDGTGTLGATPCTACPTGTTTRDSGATSAADCNLCAQGYGGPTAASCKPCQDGYYGPSPAIRGDSTECKLCPAGRSYTYDWNSGPDTYKPRATSPVGAASASECLAELFQNVDGSFFLNLKESAEYAVVDGRETFGSCVEYCAADDGCAVATYDYFEGDCKAWKPKSSASSSFKANGGLAFKTVFSDRIVESVSDIPDDKSNKGSNDASAARVSASSSKATSLRSPLKRILLTDVKAQTFGSGMYTYWTDASAVAATVDASSLENEAAASTLEDCLWKCTMNSMCAGVAFGPFDIATGALTGVIPGTAVPCQRIQGTTQPGDSRRSMIKTKFTALDPK